MSLKKDNFLDLKQKFMKLALDLAKQNNGLTGTNPSVGCVVTSNNKIISFGKTEYNGRPHAEVVALKNLKKLNDLQIYVTLEPCTHFGKTPPCTNLIIKKKINRVNYSIEDFDNRTKNKSKKTLRNKKITSVSGLLRNEVNNFYKDYKYSKTKKLPYVVGKLAISNNNKIFLNKNKITNDHSHKVSHLLRYRNQAILSSYKTINSDNPSLNCRIPGLEKFSPAKFIIDKNLDVKLNSKIFSLNQHKTYIIHNQKNKSRLKKFNKSNAKLIFMNLKHDNFILKNLLNKIYEIGYSSLLVESGPNLLTSFIKSNLINEFYLFKNSNNINVNNTIKVHSFIDLLNKKFKERSKINTYLKKDKLFRYN